MNAQKADLKDIQENCCKKNLEDEKHTKEHVTNDD